LFVSNNKRVEAKWNIFIAIIKCLSWDLYNSSHISTVENFQWVQLIDIYSPTSHCKLLCTIPILTISFYDRLWYTCQSTFLYDFFITGLSASYIVWLFESAKLGARLRFEFRQSKTCKIYVVKKDLTPASWTNPVSKRSFKRPRRHSQYLIFKVPRSLRMHYIRQREW
jgi:hypothetical protein